MLSYLIHATVLWIIALLVYELWLRRTTFHSANRWYLNAGIALPLLLPLYHPETPRPDALAALHLPMQEVAFAERQVTVVAENADKRFNLGGLLLAVAVAGAAIELARRLRELWILRRWRHNAKRTVLYGHAIYMTGADHGPFSAFGAIYLSAAATYSSYDLRFILVHEATHIRHAHSIDKAAMLLLRCAFWWHPLIHLHYARLMQVHEFEADAPMRAAAPQYGRFLIEECLAVRGASIAHQFFHSPLQTRIRMLQRYRTRTWQKAGYITALLLLAGGSYLWTNKTLATKRSHQGNLVVFNGNRFEFGAPALPTGDTFANNGAAELTGKAWLSHPADTSNAVSGFSPDFKTELVPLTMNGQRIYQPWELDKQATLAGGRTDLVQALIGNSVPSLKKLDDGLYDLGLRQLVVDENGQAAFYVNHLNRAFTAGADDTSSILVRMVPEPLLQAINSEVGAGIEGLQFSPAMKDGRVVPAFMRRSYPAGRKFVEVRKGTVTTVNPGHQ